MTVKELYELAKAMMFEKKTSKDYDGYYKPYINILLSENFSLNNNLRINGGKEPLTDIPLIELDSDEIPYEPVVCREILPNGLAMYFFIDDDLSKFNVFNTNYINAQTKYMKGVDTSVSDVYGGE